MVRLAVVMLMLEVLSMLLWVKVKSTRTTSMKRICSPFLLKQHTRHLLDGEWDLRFVRKFDAGSVCLWIGVGGEGNRG